MTVTLQNTAQSSASMRTLYRVQREQAMTYRALSSGRRVHRAAEDAAGLAVSETLDAQVRSQTAAQRNVNDGISMIQTAEGGIKEMSDLVKRMRELAVQAASETLSDTERGYAQEEFGALSEEIARIQNNTVFGGIHLLDGSWKGEIQIGIHGDANHRIESRRCNPMKCIPVRLDLGRGWSLRILYRATLEKKPRFPTAHHRALPITLGFQWRLPWTATPLIWLRNWVSLGNN